MATLAGSTIASTYTYLLKMDATSGITSSLVAVQDGDATDSALSISTTSASIGHTVTTVASTPKALFVDANTSGVAAQDATGMHIDFDRTVAGSGTAAHNDIGINLDVNSASLGTSTAIGMDIDVVGATGGTHKAIGLTVDVGSSDTNYAALFNGGNVGIGVVAPQANLHVNDDTASSEDAGVLLLSNYDTSFSDTTGLGQIHFGGTRNNTHWGVGAMISAEAAEAWDADNEYGTDMFFRTAAIGASSTSVRMSILSSGNVGIGEVAPQKALHITKTDDCIIILDGNGTSTDKHIVMAHEYGASSGHHWSMGVDQSANSGAGQFVIAYDANSQASFTDDDFFNITSTGNVGIGTDSPSEPLEIAGADSNGLRIQYADGDVGQINFYEGSNRNTAIASNESADGFIFKTGGTGGSLKDTMIMASAGEVTKPLQPAFCASPSSSQDNIAINTEVTIIFGTERFDQGGDFASNTFTAPVTGKYQLNAVIRIDGLDIDAAYYDLKFQTSNQTYTTALFDPDGLDSDPAYWNMAGSVLADMDASDTAYVVLRQSAGAAQADISADSFFSGYLAC